MSAVLLAILLPAPQSPPHAVDFARDVQPIFEASCVSCHGPKKRKAGLRLDSLEAVLEGSPGGRVVLPGDSKGSELWSRLTDPDPQERMPQKKPPLQAAEIDTIRRWIDEGAHGSAAPSAA